LLAGRKLLLADDSPTIQKVVELTFADEGVEVTSVGSGAEALEKLAEEKPDVVLADVYMPLPSGYEICKFIKENAELKHIPVMLLVGSFEPFDEAEARKVGADDILTKPFQSIRRLIDRVGGLVSGKQDPDQVPTAELPHAKEVEPERMSTDELELTTANTQPLPAGVSAEAFALKHPSADIPTGAVNESESEPSTTNQMETSTLQNEATLDSDILLDLGEPAPAPAANAEDLVLDIDIEPAAVGVADNGARHSAFVEPQVSAPASVDWQLETEPSDLMFNRTTGELAQPKSSSQMEDTLEWQRGASHESADAVSAHSAPTFERVFDEPVAAAAASSQPGNLTAEQIEVIARRAVELLSERVVQQIAWEVVPQLAELMIKRKLEEKETQPK
jgi:CheY-like chemotaxis protein